MSILIVKDGQQLGPFTADEVKSQIAGGMLDPTDLGWVDGYETWVPLCSMPGLAMPDDQQAANPGPASVDEVESTSMGLKAAGEESVAKARGGKWKWASISVFVILGILGVYQFVLAKGDPSSLCSILVEVVLPPKNIQEDVPPHVQKYRNAATASQKTKTPIDAVNERLDLRGDFHFTRNVSGLTQPTDDWFTNFSRESAVTPKAKRIVDLLQSALKSGGIEEVKAHGMSSVAVKTNLFRHTAMLYHPTNSIGRLWKELDNNGTSLTGMRLMPPDTVLAIHGRVRLGELSRWVGELNAGLTDSKLLRDAWQALKSEVPIEQLRQSWNGEVGLYVTLSTEKFRASNAARTELGKPGLMLVLGVKDGQIEKILSQQLSKWQEPERQVQINKKPVQLKVYEKPEMSGQLDKLELIPSICQAGNYLVLSIGARDNVGESALNRNVSTSARMMKGSKNWAELSSQSSSNISVPKANLALFLSPEFRDELEKWQKLDFWKDIDPELQKTLMSLAGSKQDGGVLAFTYVLPDGVLFKSYVHGNDSERSFQRVKQLTRTMLAFTHVLPDGVLFKSYVHGNDSERSFQRVKQLTRTMLAELVPKLAKFAHKQWSELEMPAESKTEEPSKTGS